ncbi:ATP-dependent zinc metalloprotease FtsH [Thalassoroseus pseudoceratinae]|uniref:ATP-dependent zinc metalloprotease FtsH n=1 Tax=Thalassoroseus pseudoceratinae TaxID=2713176 RepID=UPI0014204602|nr:ATP-dependent zinc metalloprotease FtsH [Thalassoroseus pseudoceratinae]
MSDPKPERRPERSPQRPNRRESGDDAPKPSFSGGWLIVVVVIGLLIYFMYQQNPLNSGAKVLYSEFLDQLEAKNVEEVQFHGDVITGKWKQQINGEKQFNTPVPLPALQDPDLPKRIRRSGAVIAAEPADGQFGSQLILWLIGPVMIIAFFLFIMRRSADPMGGGMMGNFIRSQARRFNASEQRTTFDDVAAMQQAKMELQEIVEFLKNPAKFQRLGAQIPKGVLLMGSPGTGKTLLARATAGEAGVPFYSINGSEFIQMFVGVGASRVRDLFRTAKDNAPCIVFIDEIDAVGRVRGAGVGGGHDEREQTLNQILSEMDGFTPSEAVIVIAATNRPDVLDPALLRPGRFDRHITIDRPTREGRFQILKIHSRKVPLGEDVDLQEVANATIGFSGAELKNLVNEAALNAARTSRSAVNQDDFDYARDRVLMGPKREEVLSDHEKEMTAYHEAGHALLGWLLPDADAVHKVTIIPRGRALGVTQFLPDEERYSIGEKRLRTQLIVALGGRAAEKLIFDEYTAGGENDLKQVTRIARRMIANWGMSQAIGPVYFNQGEEHPFLGREMHEQRHYSDETARQIDEEVQRFLNGASAQAIEILTEQREHLDKIAESLQEHEAIDRKMLEEICGKPNQYSLNGHATKTE